MARIALPPQTVPVMDDQGGFTVPWRRFVEGLFVRTGGAADLTITPTSDTVLTFKYKGSDGVVRSGTLTLS